VSLFCAESTDSQSKPAASTRFIITGALLVAASLAPMAPPSSALLLGEGATATLQSSPAHGLKDAAVSSPDASPIIMRVRDVATNPELRDDDEPAPPPHVVEAAIRIVSEAFELLSDPVPTGKVGTYFGELNVTWRSGPRMVRLACFPDRPPLVQRGSLAEPLGSYRSVPDATGQTLASAIGELYPCRVV